MIDTPMSIDKRIKRTHDALDSGGDGTLGIEIQTLLGDVGNAGSGS